MASLGKSNVFGEGGLGTFEWQDYQRGRFPYPRRLFEVINDYHRQGGAGWERVIDFGAGDCTIEPQLLKDFTHVEATDEHDGQLKIGQARLKAAGFGEDRLTTRQCPAGHHPGADGSADMITAATCVHFFDVTAFLKDAHRLLRPGGTLAIWNGCHTPIFIGGGPPAMLNEAQRVISKWLNAVLDEFVEACPPVARYLTLKGVEPDPDLFVDQLRHYFWFDSPNLSSRNFGTYDEAVNSPGRARMCFEAPQRLEDIMAWRDDYTIKDLDASARSVGRAPGKKPWIEDPLFIEVREELKNVLGGEDATATVAYQINLLLARKKAEAK
ncbi:unnamed protein product [Parajaminaea phylloscopi]